MSDKALKRFDIDAYGERVYRDSGAFVQADDATREIERLEARVRELEATIHEWEITVPSSTIIGLNNELTQVKQERDRLAEKVRELEGELPGKLKGERALADEQIRCFHEQAVNVEQERDRLRGLIEALPAMTHAQLGAAIELLFEESWPPSFSTALAALLKARQEMP